MVGAVVTAVPLVAIAGAVVLLAHRASRRLPRSVRPWVVAGVLIGVLTVATYGWGAAHLYTPDISETCALVHGIAWDARVGGTTLLPLSRQCAAGVDLVPGYVNPALAGLALAVTACLGMAARAWTRTLGGVRT
ncbi:hypothetical protein [Actinokineospora diospyrosa]|uniref:Disulfide bond formation protein DsbB n=1 Tax=Actinokineospora diospyrosa TaxID=103728 RepID=A0ABT1I5B3_9PSEU|nr:hypothetical protein [Actinokineospora diospyrosa]MCP2267818.1 hypothetical protein [Actinokineospora diospyrosa]